MIQMLKEAKKVVLIEPEYRRKYIPLGLAKIATFVKNNGGEVIFKRKYAPENEDLVCVTSLFTYQSEKVLQVLIDIEKLNKSVNVIVGGVYATLMPEDIQSKFPNVNIFKGYSKKLDLCPPDYSIDWGVEDPWNEFSFVFTTRGCPNRCPYCAVSRTEPEQWVNPNWKKHIDLAKPCVMISDNNLSSQPIEHVKEVCNFLIEHKKKVVFDNGFDCKYITPEIAELLSKIKYVGGGLRLAFDRIQDDIVFQKAIKMLLDAGIKKHSIMAYVLFNFTDTPIEAIYRANECVKLGIRPYPQMYTPLNKKDRNEVYLGKHWTKNLAGAFRFFYLMAGCYKKYGFIDWLINKNDKFEITKDDLKCLVLCIPLHISRINACEVKINAMQ